MARGHSVVLAMLVLAGGCARRPPSDLIPHEVDVVPNKAFNNTQVVIQPGATEEAVRKLDSFLAPKYRSDSRDVIHYLDSQEAATAQFDFNNPNGDRLYAEHCVAEHSDTGFCWVPPEKRNQYSDLYYVPGGLK